MVSYTVKTIKEKEDMKQKKKAEHVLKDLLAVIPTLRKHKLEGEIITKVKKLRDGRKAKAFTLELTRTFQGKELKVSSPVTKADKRMEILRGLKDEIRTQIQGIRKQNRTVYEDFTFSQGVTVPKLAEIYLEPGTFVKVMGKKIRIDMVRTGGRKPNTADNYIGVEIEFASKKDREFIADRLFEAGLGKYVNIKGDGSIKVDNDYPQAHEICILVRQNEYTEIINRLCHVLNTECQVRVDKSCGLHVHVDMRNRKVEKAFHNLVSVQQFLYAMLPANRRNSRYSYPIKGTHWRVLDERYHGINSQAYQKYGTLEARMHCGTTQANKINRWIELLVATVDAPVAMPKAPTTIEELRASVVLTDGLVKYMESRIAKFKSQHLNSKPTAEQPGSMPEIEALIGTIAIDETVVEDSEVA